ncbi:MAG: ABC transporter permease [Ruminococcus sp.]|nr:ABC transporter permease [Ruminococcus sp.]
MQVFKLFFKIAKTKWLATLVFLGIFLLILNFTNIGGGTDTFKTSKMSLTIFDHDKTDASRQLCDYLAKDNIIVDFEDDKDKLIDALYITSTNYVITINEGYEEKLAKGETDGLFSTRYLHDSYTNKLADSTLDTYVSTVKAYLAGGMELSKAIDAAQEALSEKTEVSFETFENDSAMSSSASFFNYMPYALLSIIVSVLCPVIIAMNKKEVGFRTKCSSIKSSSVTAQTVAASGIFVVVIWVMLMALCVGKNGGMFTGNMWYAVLNSVSFTLVCVAIALLFAELRISENVLAFVTQVLGLGMAFLCGMFVPQEMLSSSVLAVARFLPAYWYIKANDMICAIGTEQFRLSTVLMCIGIQMLFAAAIFAVSVVVKKQKKAI